MEHVLGLHVPAADLTWWQMSSRALVVFVWGVLLVRFADRRLLGRNAGFDMLLIVVLGSVLSRGVNGQAAFFPTLGVCAVLVGLHYLTGTVACHSDRISRMIKGVPRILVRDGRRNPRELRRAKITEEDLQENLRLYGNVAHLDQVREARLERNGEISVVRRKPPAES